ncbi:MAG: hypothetical protein ACI83H_001940 [Glaciecola sp.]|jgi:hypothetical protein
MKQFLLTIVTLSLLLFSCNKGDDNVTDDITQYTYATLSKIVTEDLGDITFATIEEGDNLVFNYRFTASQDDYISDDEYGERIIFEIDANATAFNYSDDELASILTYFNQYCFCANTGSILIINGSINGLKSNGTNWDIDIDITVQVGNDTRPINISGIFKLE